MNDKLFSMDRDGGKEPMSMASFMIPSDLKQEVKNRAERLGTTSTRFFIDAVRARLAQDDRPPSEAITMGADEYIKRKAISTLLMAHLTSESPAQAWALAYRRAWNDAIDFCIRAEREFDKEENQ